MIAVSGLLYQLLLFQHTVCKNLETLLYQRSKLFGINYALTMYLNLYRSDLGQISFTAVFIFVNYTYTFPIRLLCS